MRKGVHRTSFVLAGAALLAACAAPPDAPSQAAQCRQTFERYDRAVRSFPNYSYSGNAEAYILPGNVSRQVVRIQAGGCLTGTDDLDGLEALGSRLAARAPAAAGAAIPPTAVHAGILTSQTDVTRATVFFRSLGYGTRTIGADQLGRRMYIGPFRTEGALAEAIATARQAGFVSPYASTAYRFWPWRL